MFCGSVGSKSRLAKVAGVESPVQMRNEKLHAAVARSTFSSQNVQDTPCSDHFWKFRWRKIARRCGAKHICRCGAKHMCVRTTFGSSAVEKLHDAAARSTFSSQNAQRFFLAHLHLKSLRKQLPFQQGLFTILNVQPIKISNRSTWLLTLTMMCPG